MALTSKASEMRQNGEDVIVLTVGEPDFDTPQYIKDAGKAAIDQGLTKYTSVDGTASLKKAIINKFKNENNLDYSMDEIIVSSGCKQSIFNLLQVLVDEGDEVIIPQPYWVSYADMVVYSGGIPVLLETQYDKNFDIDPNRLESLINEKTKLFMLNSPNNPSGKYFDSKAQYSPNILWIPMGNHTNTERYVVFQKNAFPLFLSSTLHGRVVNRENDPLPIVFSQ